MKNFWKKHKNLIMVGAGMVLGGVLTFSIMSNNEHPIQLDDIANDSSGPLHFIIKNGEHGKTLVVS